ncbi:hypothetical protein L208DRAFT_1546966, partial [Tricholoma matsutake]
AICQLGSSSVLAFGPLGFSSVLCSVSLPRAGLTPATLARTTQRDDKGRFLPSTTPKTTAQSSATSSFTLPSVSDISISPISTSPRSPPAIPPPTPQFSAPTTPTPSDDEDTMSDDTKLFWGDDKHKDKNPRDFINAIERQFSLKTNVSNAQKLRTFELNLKAGSVANQWWDSLSSGDNDTWEHLVASFTKRWPTKPPTVKTVEEKQAALERTTITEEEVGK